MTRLPRSRKGKTPIDVTVTRQPAGPRVRLSVGKPNGLGQVNSDLDMQEVDDLVTLLLYHKATAEGKIESPEPSETETRDHEERMHELLRTAAARGRALAPNIFRQMSWPGIWEFTAKMLLGKTVHAIKVLRVETGMPLHEAKDAYQSLTSDETILKLSASYLHEERKRYDF